MDVVAKRMELGPLEADLPKDLAERLNILIGGHFFFQVLASAVDLGLFDALKRTPDLSAEQISKQISIPPRSAQVLLLACCSLGLIKRSPDTGCYSNQPSTNELFCTKTARSLTTWIRAYNLVSYKAMAFFPDALKKGTNTGLQCFSGTGETLYERLAAYPAEQDSFYEWMNGISVNLPSSFFDAIGPATHVLDVGGGAKATVTLQIADRFPDKKVTLMDLPEVCEKAKKAIAKYGDRVTVHGGDFRNDAFPTGVDCIVLSHVINIYSEAANRVLIQRCAQILKKGGAVVLYNAMANANETGPLNAAALSVYFFCLATGDGMVYSTTHYKKWFEEAGFSSMTVYETEGGRICTDGLVVIRK